VESTCGCMGWFHDEHALACALRGCPGQQPKNGLVDFIGNTVEGGGPDERFTRMNVFLAAWVILRGICYLADGKISFAR
jgi:hypothetical protein